MLKLNGENVITGKFPNNETKVKDSLYVKDRKNILELQYESDADLILLKFVKDHLDMYYGCQTNLFIWYMPYSRMDRKIEGDIFTLESICDYIAGLGFEAIYVMEPHSKVTLEELETFSNSYYEGSKVRAIYPTYHWLPKVKEEIGFTENDHIVFPDKGAAARYKNKRFGNICIMEKKRDPATGEILDMTLIKGQVNPGSKCIIIDDLCSKGGTFAWAASILKELGASEVYLIVTHCEETIFAGKLLDDNSPIKKIYTSKSMMSKEHPKIHYMDVDVESYII